MSDFKQVGIGKPNAPTIGDKAMKGRRWEIDPYGSGKSYPKIKRKVIKYKDFYEELCNDNVNRGLEVDKVDHTIDDDHTKTATRPLNKQSQSPLVIGE